MSKEVIPQCDAPDCHRRANEFIVYDYKQAKAVDLCSQHAKPLIELANFGQDIELPARPRSVMTPTKLKTTRNTEQFKKRKTPAKP